MSAIPARAKRGPSCSTGFTLIELIITVAILAVLVTIVVVALNPAEQLKRSRDAKRVGDLDAIKTALNLYLAQATSTINLSGDTTVNDRCIGGAAATFFVNSGAEFSNPSGFAAVATSSGQLPATSSVVLAAGSWMPALIGQTPGGTPLAQLPLDPTTGVSAASSTYYGYGCRLSNDTFELTARLESTYFNSDLNVIGTDGGNSSSTYEVGTDLTIVPGGW
jgi:prepilin-type N-terminal cleavage/methylation domain-containing protein